MSLSPEERARYEIFRSRNDKCHHCGVRLKWDAYQVRGLSGGWRLDEESLEDSTQALCFKCFEFPGRKKASRQITVTEVQRKSETTGEEEG